MPARCDEGSLLILHSELLHLARIGRLLPKVLVCEVEFSAVATFVDSQRSSLITPALALHWLLMLM